MVSKSALHPNLLGALLAGGQSRRFGSAKDAALLRGQTLLARAAEQLAPHVDALVLCGAEREGFTCLADRPPEVGPLGGLNAALHHARANGYAAVLTTACDMPLLPAAVVGALIGDGPAVLDRFPVVAFWPSALGPVLDAFLATAGGYAVAAWADHIGARRVQLDVDLPNINTPADLAALEAIWIEPGAHFRGFSADDE